MTPPFNPALDLQIARLIKAPRARVWATWADPALFEKWWIPAPARCRVVSMDLAPGGAFKTLMSENGGAFGPHLDACFLAVEPQARIVFSNALTEGFRPADNPFMTAIITLTDHPLGTNYAAHVMHKSPDDRDMHRKLGFDDGWGTVIEQLAALVESPA